MPRKSAAEQNVVRPDFHKGLPQPPAELTADERVIWRELTACMPPDWFRPESYTQLTLYCHHVISARHISQLIHKCDPKTHLNRYEQLLRMQEKETRTITALARAMRLTHQSRFDRYSAAGAAKKPKASDRNTEYVV